MCKHRDTKMQTFGDTVTRKSRKIRKNIIFELLKLWKLWVNTVSKHEIADFWKYSNPKFSKFYKYLDFWVTVALRFFRKHHNKKCILLNLKSSSFWVTVAMKIVRKHHDANMRTFHDTVYRKFLENFKKWEVWVTVALGTVCYHHDAKTQTFKSTVTRKLGKNWMTSNHRLQTYRNPIISRLTP